MKRSGKCPKCSSTEIIADAEVVDRGEAHMTWELTLKTYKKPDAFLFKGERTSTLSAWVCAKCGFVELYADAPKELKV